MYIKQIPVGSMKNFSYLIGEKQGDVMYIDPGWDAEKVLKIAQQDQVKIKAVLLTHNHYDHAQETEKVLKNTNCDLYVGDSVKSEYLKFGNKVHILKDGINISIGKFKIIALYTPGHKEDSFCFLFGNNLFTGDTLFIGNVGRTDLPEGDSKKLVQSLKKIAKLDGNTIIYPGHDYGKVPYQSLSKEIKTNSAFKFHH